MLITFGWTLTVLQRSDTLSISLDFSLLKFRLHISSPDSKPDKYAGDDDHLHQCDGETSAYLLSKDDWLLAYLLPIGPLFWGSLSISNYFLLSICINKVVLLTAMEFLRADGVEIQAMETLKETTNSGEDNASSSGDIAVETQEGWPDHQGECKRRPSGTLLNWFRAIGERILNKLAKFR